MSDAFEDRLRAQLRTHARRVRLPGDPADDVRRRARRQDLVRRSVSGVAALAAIVVVVGVVWPTLAVDQITLDHVPAEGGGRTDSSGPESAEPAQPDTMAGAPASCSAAGLSPEPSPQPQLPPAVATTRERIVWAAVACDYEALAEIAAAGEPFTHSFGDTGDPADHWRRAERGGEEALRVLVELLDTPHGEVEGSGPVILAWPSAFVREDWDEVTAEERAALRPLYDDEDFEDFAMFGSYIGYRVGITVDGDWRYFVAGD